MVDFIYEIAHTDRFDNVSFSDIKEHAEDLLDTIEDEYVLASKKFDA